MTTVADTKNEETDRKSLIFWRRHDESAWTKEAVLITAYHKFDQLKELSELLSRKFEVYIHIVRRYAMNSLPQTGGSMCFPHIRSTGGAAVI